MCRCGRRCDGALGHSKISERSGLSQVWSFANLACMHVDSVSHSTAALLGRPVRASVSGRAGALTRCGSAHSPAIFTLGDMTTTHQVRVRSNHIDVTRRHTPFIAAGVAAAACAVVAISSIGSSGERAVVDLDVEPIEVELLNAIEPVSALLDGRAFAAAVEAGMSDIQSRSILLDGAAFELAVNEAVAVVANGSALLYGTGFADAVAKAVTAATG